MGNKTKPTIKTLSRVSPTPEELNQLMNAFGRQSAPAIVTAILGAIMVEHELENILRRRFPKVTDDEWYEMLSDQGPLGTFSRKINLGFSFRLYDKVTLSNLHTVRHIRNVFAHSKKLIDLSMKP